MLHLILHYYIRELTLQQNAIAQYHKKITCERHKKFKNFNILFSLRFLLWYLLYRNTNENKNPVTMSRSNSIQLLHQ